MAVSEPSNTLARPQLSALVSSPYDVEHLAECSPAAAPIAEPSLGDYAGIVILFSAIWAVCIGAAAWNPMNPNYPAGFTQGEHDRTFGGELHSRISADIALGARSRSKSGIATSSTSTTGAASPSTVPTERCAAPRRASASMSLIFSARPTRTV